MSETNIQQKIAQRRLQVFEYQFGSGTLRLAYHAALPIVLNRELLHLMRTHFFASSAKESLPDSAETDLLLSPLCQKIGVDDLYKMEPAVRELLLLLSKHQIREIVHPHGHECPCYKTTPHKWDLKKKP